MDPTIRNILQPQVMHSKWIISLLLQKQQEDSEWRALMSGKDTLHGGWPRIPSDRRKVCLDFFREGCGYKRTARLTGLNAYTVRDYLRRYRNGDLTWVERGGSASREDHA